MMTWVISIVIAVVFLAILVGVCCNDRFADIFGVIFVIGITVTALTLMVHLLFFE